MTDIVLTVIDGLADESIPDFDDKTPLEAAHTPNLDQFAAEGVVGEVEVFHQKKKLPTSEESHLALFGYDPYKYNPGRGVLETLGLGVAMQEGDVCFRGNFATLSEESLVVDRRAGRIADTEAFVAALQGIEIEGVQVLVHKGLSHRVCVVLRGEGVTADVADCDHKEVNVKPLEAVATQPAGEKAARVVNEFLQQMHDILDQHPENVRRREEGKLVANYMLLRGAGTMREVASFEQRFGLKGCYVAGAPLYKGIAKYLGMEEIVVEGATGLVNTNLDGKVAAARWALADYDFCFMHIKATDNLAEDGDYVGKKDFLEKIDESLVGFRNIGALIAVTGDHATCSLHKSHCTNPVPLVLYGATADSVATFAESTAGEGLLGSIPQLQVMETLLRHRK